MSLYQRLLGNPFVYNHVRPFVVGGVDHGPSWKSLEVGPEDVVLDVGCGTGDALNHLGELRGYHGFDTDPIAIGFARKRAAARGDTYNFQCAIADERAVAAIAPTRVMLCGLLHHLSDGDSLELLRLLARTPSVRRIVTIDTVYLPKKYVNNFLAWLDRGKFVRVPSEYRSLVERAGLRVLFERVVRSHPTKGRAEYVVFGLEPRAS